MGKRRPSGDGMVRKHPDGRREGRTVVGRKADGSSIFRYLYADTQKELTTKLRQNTDAYQNVELTEQNKMTLAQWLDRWSTVYMAGVVRPNTLEGCRRDTDNHVKPYLGKKPLCKVTADDLRGLHQILLEHGRKPPRKNCGSGLTPAAVRGAHTTLHRVLKTVTDEGLIPFNPVGKTTPPSMSNVPKRVLAHDQLEKFPCAIQFDSIWHDSFYTELTTGLRREELCGFRWEDFNGQAGALQIRRTIRASKGGELAVGEAKTYAGQRMIPFPHSTAQLLRRREKVALTQWLFPDPLRPGRPVNPGNACRRLKELLKQAKLPNLRFHDLRHTFATHTLAFGVDAKILSGIPGHTKASFTLGIYTHATGDMHRNVAEIMGNVVTE